MIESVINVGLKRPHQTQIQFDYGMNELKRLVETAGGQVDSEIFQTRATPDPGTFLGIGKLEEIAELALQKKIKTVIFDDNLSPAQQKNIEKIIKAKIIDRTRLILDIFAGRARSKEGQLQVELAQLNYMVPRLTGSWRGYSQQSGGIGTRGPGERKIEVERRYVQERIKYLKRNIEEIKQHRERARTSRKAIPVPQIGLVGYTNVGKSTLLNTLTGSEKTVYADDKLFATLDPTTRRVKLPGGQWVVFTDTVGFIQKLPPFLVAAFRSTLEELKQANLLIHLVDLSAENYLEQMTNVVETIKELKADQIPMMTIYNKADTLTVAHQKVMAQKGYQLISSKNKTGIDQFLYAIEKKLDESLIDVTFNLPYKKRSLLSEIYQSGHVVAEKESGEGTELKIKINPVNWEKILYQLNQG